MNKEVLGFQINNGICEASGCFKKATTKTKVKVGQLGSISLDVCANCVRKFDEKEQSSESFGKLDLKQKITIDQWTSVPSTQQNLYGVLLKK
jgi:hypothetical protein